MRVDRQRVHTGGGRRRGESGYRGEYKLDDCMVLCAQPDHALRETLMEALSNARAVSAMTGLESVNALDAGFFNLYIVDYSLPDWTGLGLCRHIRKRDRLGPICFYTHADVEGLKASALACGADMFLRPTMDTGELRTQLEDALKFRAARLAAWAS